MEMVTAVDLLNKLGTLKLDTYDSFESQWFSFDSVQIAKCCFTVDVRSYSDFKGYNYTKTKV